jgi:hypothetical protein
LGHWPRQITFQACPQMHRKQTGKQKSDQWDYFKLKSFGTTKGITDQRSANIYSA